jgi:hypothetical protein
MGSKGFCIDVSAILESISNRGQSEILGLLPIKWVRNGKKVFGVRAGQGFLGDAHLSFPRSLSPQALSGERESSDYGVSHSQRKTDEEMEQGLEAGTDREAESGLERFVEGNSLNRVFPKGSRGDTGFPLSRE